MILSYTDEVTAIFRLMNLPDDVIHLILFHKKKAELEEALQYNLEMRSMWNYSNYPYFHKYHMHLLDIQTSLNVLFDENFWNCVLQDVHGNEIAVIQNISQLSARPQDKLYEPVEPYFSHKPWDNPMVHRLQKLIYTTQIAIHLMQSGVVAPTPRHTILMDMKRNLHPFGTRSRDMIFKSIR